MPNLHPRHRLWLARGVALGRFWLKMLTRAESLRRSTAAAGRRRALHRGPRGPVFPDRR